MSADLLEMTPEHDVEMAPGVGAWGVLCVDGSELLPGAQVWLSGFDDEMTWVYWGPPEDAWRFSSQRSAQGAIALISVLFAGAIPCRAAPL